MPEVDCADCGARVKVPPSILRDLADGFEARWPDKRASDTTTVGDLTWRWTVEAVDGPTCIACRAPVADSNDPELRCDHCTESTPAAVAPPVFREKAPSARRVFGADLKGDRPVIALAPVAMSCPQCGAGLSVTDAWQRLSPCSFCGASVHLPDAVWRQLHPPRTVGPWTVRFEGESRPAERARIAAEKEAAKRRAHEEDEARRERAAAEKREAREAEARRKAAEERSWRLRTLPVVVLAWAALPATLVAQLAACAWYFLGTPTILLGRVSPTMLAAAPPLVVFAAAAAALVGWCLAFLAYTLRTRRSFWAVLPVAGFQLFASCIPMVGWFLLLVHLNGYLRGLEPTVGKAEGPAAPWNVRVPLAGQLGIFGTFVYVWVAAALAFAESM